MKDALFYDTSAWIALFDKDDDAHEQVSSWHAEVAAKKLFIVTSNFVLSETHSFFCQNPSAAVKIANTILKSRVVRYQRVTVEDEKKAWEIVAKYHDKDFSFCDATSFALIERLGIPLALSLDKHFKQYGIRLYG